jgi:predicted RecA/RadA family phage recombinase
MSGNYIQPGSVLEFTAGSNIAAGAVVKAGALVGVALMAIANGSTGPVQIDGVFRCPKVSTAVIAQGVRLLWDVSANSGAGAFDVGTATPATGDVSGEAFVAFAAAGNGDTTVLVKFTGVPGIVT